MINSLRIISASLLVLLCCWVIYHSGKMALADIIHYPVKKLIEEPQLGVPVSATVLEKAQDKIDRAISINPQNAEYREYQARVFYLRAINNHADPELFEQQIYKAYLAHKKALQLRPQWPYSWANLALMKSHMQQLDVEFLYAINQAAQYGPWEISSNQAIVQAGFTSWQKLSGTMQQKILDALERIYQQAPHSARALLKHYALASTVCPKIKLEKLIKDRACANTSAS